MTSIWLTNLTSFADGNKGIGHGGFTYQSSRFQCTSTWEIFPKFYNLSLLGRPTYDNLKIVTNYSILANIAAFVSKKRPDLQFWFSILAHQFVWWATVPTVLCIFLQCLTSLSTIPKLPVDPLQQCCIRQTWTNNSIPVTGLHKNHHYHELHTPAAADAAASGVFRNLKGGGVISGVHFQKCSKFCLIFFTLNFSTKNSPPGSKGGGTSGSSQKFVSGI